jgi:hypothetical protein
MPGIPSGITQGLRIGIIGGSIAMLHRWGVFCCNLRSRAPDRVSHTEPRVFTLQNQANGAA